MGIRQRIVGVEQDASYGAMLPTGFSYLRQRPTEGFRETLADFGGLSVQRGIGITFQIADLRELANREMLERLGGLIRSRPCAHCVFALNPEKALGGAISSYICAEILHSEFIDSPFLQHQQHC